MIPNGRQGAIYDIKVGDILLLKYRKHLIAYGRATSALLTDKDMDDWDHRIDIQIWIKGNSVSFEGIKDAQIGGTNHDTVKKVKVKTAIQDINYIEITEGLKEGDIVITGPYEVVSKSLKEKDKVRVVDKKDLFDKK